ncbi:hypothetical protein [Hymenobacter sp.]|jgi:hypothetical protein|uniref:hypothetical protein n=1 Tax=Hymenobacter sp. TaxID=1898978 RepID=UPI002ED9FB44
MPDLLTEITHAARAYYGQWHLITATETDFRDWLQELPPAEHLRLANSGFAVACTQRAFQRFCLEWRGYPMRDFMGETLSVDAYMLWQKVQEFNGELPDGSG